MQNIITGTKLFFLGLYIEFTRFILNFTLKYSEKPFSSQKAVFLSKLCNYASLSFIKLEKKFK